MYLVAGQFSAGERLVTFETLWDSRQRMQRQWRSWKFPGFHSNQFVPESFPASFDMSAGPTETLESGLLGATGSEPETQRIY